MMTNKEFQAAMPMTGMSWTDTTNVLTVKRQAALTSAVNADGSGKGRQMIKGGGE